FDCLRPWAASMTLMQARGATAGVQAKTGADLTIGDLAAADHKEMRGFEKPGESLRSLAELPAAAQLEMLADQLDSADQTPAALTAMEQSWRAGDPESEGDAAIQTLKAKAPNLYEAVIRRRNLAWFKTLQRELAGDETELVNVGALHMVG